MATAEIAPPRPLTARQRALYEYIFEFTTEHGYQPSIREVMAAFGISGTNGIACYLEAFAAKGWASSSETKSRALRFLYCPDGRPFRGFKPR